LLFIRNANLLDRENIFDAIREAREQGAFIFWNHPGWKAQQPDTTLWWAEHTQLLKNNMIHGLEVFNYDEYYPEAIDWAREKKLTVLANSDLHEPSGMKYGGNNIHRPMTLVFSKSRTEGGIREALFNQRTIAFYNNTLVGRANLLEPLFFSSMRIVATPGVLRNGGTKKIEIINTSDIHYDLELVQPGLGFDAPASVALKPHHMTILELNGNSEEVAEVKELKIFYRVKNMLLSSTENLVITFSISNL
jgi:3',5'-nucleoside bisphosphate phosphatase